MPSSTTAYTWACVAIMLAVLSGCSAKQRGQSGFLADYSGLTPSPNVDGAMAYRNPNFDLAKYRKFIIDPIGVHFAPDASGAAVDPATLQEMTQYFRAKLIEGLSKNYQVVEQPGEGTMRLRIALTDLQKANPALNIHPATKLSGVGLGAASVEAEGIDTATGKRMFAFVHTRSGDRLSIVEGLEFWSHAKQAMDFWAAKLVERVDEAHGRKAK